MKTYYVNIDSIWELFFDYITVKLKSILTARLTTYILYFMVATISLPRTAPNPQLQQKAVKPARQT